MNDGQTLRSALSSLVSDADAATTSPGLDALDPAIVGQALFHFASAAPVAVVARLGGLLDELDPLGAGTGPAELFSANSITGHLETYDADLDDISADDDLDDDGVHRVGPAEPDDGAQRPSDGDIDADSDDGFDDGVADDSGLDDEVAVSVYDSVYETEGELEQIGEQAHEGSNVGDRHLDPKQGDFDDRTADDWADDLDEASQPEVISTWASDDDDSFDDDAIDLDDLNDV